VRYNDYTKINLHFWDVGGNDFRKIRLADYSETRSRSREIHIRNPCLLSERRRIYHRI